MIRFQCPGCGHSYSVPEADAGKRAKCNSCKEPFNVPVAATVERGGVTKTKPKSNLPFGNLPFPLKAILGLCVIAMVSYGVYESMPSIRELERADAERERLNKLVTEQRAERHAKVITDLTGEQSDEATRASLDLNPGDDVVLQSSNGGIVWVSPTSEDWDESIKVSTRKDEDGWRLLIAQGRLLLNASGTPAKYLSYGFEAYEVRIKGGKHAGKSGWVLKDHVVKVDAKAAGQPANDQAAMPPLSTPPVHVAGQPATDLPTGPKPAPSPQPPADRVAPPSGDLRAKWVNDTYKDRFVRRHDTGAWQEVDSNTGAVIWEEKETSRTNEYVEIYCPKRGYEIRMFVDRMELKKDGKWDWVANGRWDKGVSR